MNANKPEMAEYPVEVDRLRVGVFIRLQGIKWFKHPFFFSNFKISKQGQIDVLRSIGIKSVICVPEKSDVLPLQPERIKSSPPIPQAPPAGVDTQTQNLWQLKQERIELNKERRAKAEQCEVQYQASVETVKNIMQNIETAPQETFAEADKLLKNIVETLMSDIDVAVQLMNTRIEQEDTLFHSLNVSVLSMMLGKEYGFDSESLRVLGLGALFHDVGKNSIPMNIIGRKNLSSPERRFMRLHPKYGVDILSKVAGFPPEAVTLVYQHHERSDGQGYPLGLQNEKIALFAKIASIVNTYDNHCNKLDYQESLTPYEALAYMFSVQSEMFDKDLLSLFIHCLGVYPPGTIVKLSNGNVGMVVSVEATGPLQPNLVLYDPEIPKKEALIIALKEEPNLYIEGSIRPTALPRNIYDYLSPNTRVTYYVNEAISRTENTKKSKEVGSNDSIKNDTTQVDRLKSESAQENISN